MNFMTQPNYDFRAIARDVRRSLLVTANFERILDGGKIKHVRVSDQMRRLLLLLNELTFESNQPGVWVRHLISLARSISIDKGDCSEAVAKLLEFEVVAVDRRDDGWLWIELRAAKLAVSGRALVARAATEEIVLMNYDRIHQPEIPGIEKSLLQGRSGGFEEAMKDVSRDQDREAFANVQPRGVRGYCGVVPVGNLPTNSRETVGNLPTSELGISQPKSVRVGNLPTEHLYDRAGADTRGDSTDRQIGDSLESGAVAPDNSGRRFRDSDKNFAFEELLALDQKRELGDETSRRTWIGRIRDNPGAVLEAVGEVKDEIRRGQRITSPLGRVFVKAQSIARSAGKTFRSILFIQV